MNKFQAPRSGAENTSALPSPDPRWDFSTPNWQKSQLKPVVSAPFPESHEYLALF
jgi:hypothetical protein